MIRSSSGMSSTGLFGTEDTIRLSIRGPRSLVGREAIEISAELSKSWYTFFRDQCGFQLDKLRTPILVTSSDYSAKLGRGWMTSDIHRPIMDFMSYFQRRREMYSIRIQFEATSVRNPSLNINSADFELSYQTNNTTPGRKRQRHQSSSAVLMSSGHQNDGTGMVPLWLTTQQPSITISCGLRSSTENNSLPPKKRRYSGFPSENSMNSESSQFLTPLSSSDGIAGGWPLFGGHINMSAASSSNNSSLYESAASVLESAAQTPRTPINRVSPEKRRRTPRPTPNDPARVVTASLETPGIHSVGQTQRARTPTAKLCRPTTLNQSATAIVSPLNNSNMQPEHRRQTPAPVGRRTPTAKSNASNAKVTTRTQQQQTNKNKAKVINLVDSGDDDVNNDPNVGHHDDDNDDDMNSQITATEEEKDEMRTGGVHVNTLRHTLKNNLGRISNSLLLKAQKEMKELQQEKKWTKHVQRAPLCYMLLDKFLK